MDVLLGVKVFVPVIPGRLTLELLDTARDAEGVARVEGVFGRAPGVRGAAPTPRWAPIDARRFVDAGTEGCVGVSGSSLSSSLFFRLLGGRLFKTS
jgi:hypothetical protein